MKAVVGRSCDLCSSLVRVHSLSSLYSPGGFPMAFEVAFGCVSNAHLAFGDEINSRMHSKWPNLYATFTNIAWNFSHGNGSRTPIGVKQEIALSDLLDSEMWTSQCYLYGGSSHS